MSVIKLSRDQIFYPGQSFINIYNEHFKSEVFQVFCIAAVITFIKSFYNHQKVLNFYNEELLNKFFSFLSIPQVGWVLSYCSFFIFIYLVSVLSRVFGSREIKTKSMFYVFMSISTYGIFLQIFFAISRFVLPQNVKNIVAYLSFLGIAILFFYAIKKVCKLTATKAILILLFSATPIVFVIGMTGIFPFLMWLNI